MCACVWVSVMDDRVNFGVFLSLVSVCVSLHTCPSVCLVVSPSACLFMHGCYICILADLSSIFSNEISTHLSALTSLFHHYITLQPLPSSPLHMSLCSQPSFLPPCLPPYRPSSHPCNTRTTVPEVGGGGAKSACVDKEPARDSRDGGPLAG